MNQKLTKVLLVAVVAVFVAVGLFWIFGSGLKHIEDTNGPDNYKLNTITDEQIIRGDMGALNPVYIHQDLIGNGLTFSSDKFTGVHEILYDNFIGSSDFVLSLTSRP